MKKKILIILPYVPYPLESGGQIAVFGMIDYLRAKLEISLVVPASAATLELRQVWPDVKIYDFKQSIKLKVAKKLLNYTFEIFIKLYTLFLGGKKINKHGYDTYFFDINRNLIGLVNKLIENNRFNFIQIEFYEFLPLICFLPKPINSIFIHHELRYIRNERTEESAGQESSLKNFFLAQNKGEEIGFLKLYDRIVTVSEIDKTLLSEHIDPSKLFASPFAIKKENLDVEDYVFQDKIFLLGGSSHQPNVEGMQWFVTNCWPTIVKANKKLKLVVIGVWDEADMKIFKSHERIEFLGFVEDLKSIFKNGILAVPLKIGSGMRMKIIDAVNHHIPFVTTKVGVEGLDFQDSKDCFIADSAEEFAAKLLQLINSEKLQQTFIQNSKKVLDEKYGYKKLMQIREQIYS